MALALAGMLPGCWATTAAATPDPALQAYIHHRDGTVVPASASITQLAQCPSYPGPSYTMAMYGQGAQPLHPDDFTNYPNQVWTLANAIGCLNPHVDPRTVNTVVVVGSNGMDELSTALSVLGPGFLEPATSPFVGRQVPLIYTDGFNMVYDRPWGGGTDDNAVDQVREAATLVVNLYVGGSIPVHATASAPTVAAGGTVSFSATVPPAYGGLVYQWSFDGGAQGSQSSSVASPSATFPTAGIYHVGLLVSNAAGSAGNADVTITVTGGGTPTTSQTTPTPGPKDSAGNTPGARPGRKKKRAGAPSRRPGAKQPATGNGQQAAGAQPTTTPASAGTSTGSTGSGSRSSSAATVAARRHAKSVKPRRAAPAAPRRPAPSVTGPSTIVTGRLISDVIPLPAGQSPLVHAVAGPAATAPAMRRPITASILPALAAALGVVLLFCLGAGRELRWRRGRRRLRFGG